MFSEGIKLKKNGPTNLSWDKKSLLFMPHTLVIEVGN